MKKNIIKDIRAKSDKELLSELSKQQKNIGKLRLEYKINTPKDTNIIKKTKKHIAQLLTVINEKKFINK